MKNEENGVRRITKTEAYHADQAREDQPGQKTVIVRSLASGPASNCKVRSLAKAGRFFSNQLEIRKTVDLLKTIAIIGWRITGADA